MWCSDTIAHKCRLYPNKEEEWEMLRTKSVCRRAYNRLLEEYNTGTIDHNELSRFLTQLKKGWPELNEIYSKCLQPEVGRLFANLAALEKMKKRGHKVGKPRFKSENRYKSFTYNQSGFKLLPMNDKFGLLHLSKIGDIPIRLHREIVGEIKQVTIKHMASRKWYAYIIVDYGSSEFELTEVETAVGLDVGLTLYIVDSDGHEVENPRYLKQALKKLRREQRRLSRKQKGSNNREKQRIIVAHQYERVQNQRNDFQHNVSREYVNNYDMIVTEKLHPGKMVKNRRLARSISDVAWSSLNQKLAYKAENAGKLFVQVDPRNTSIDCSGCGKPVPKTLSDRRHNCTYCGRSLSRDQNASINILNRGVAKVRSERPELTLLDIRPLQAPAGTLQVGWMKKEVPPIRAGQFTGEHRSWGSSS
jgi:putative transposase